MMRPYTLFAVASALAMLNASAEERTYQLDPFAQATDGYATCQAAKPPVLTEQEMRATAHQRVERGTSCCLAGTCECGGAYKRDAEINDRVVATIRADKRFRDTSVWVTTTRKFVTLQGSGRSSKARQMCVPPPTTRSRSAWSRRHRAARASSPAGSARMQCR